MDVKVELEEIDENIEYCNIVLIYKDQNVSFTCSIDNDDKNSLLDKWKSFLGYFKDESGNFPFSNNLRVYVKKDRSTISLVNDAQSIDFEVPNDQFIYCIKKVINLLS